MPLRTSRRVALGHGLVGATGRLSSLLGRRDARRPAPRDEVLCEAPRAGAPEEERVLQQRAALHATERARLVVEIAAEGLSYLHSVSVPMIVRYTEFSVAWHVLVNDVFKATGFTKVGVATIDHVRSEGA